jgi:hypothetical protein
MPSPFAFRGAFYFIAARRDEFLKRVFLPRGG